MINLTVADTAPDQVRVDALVLFAHSTDDGATLSQGHRLPKAAAEHVQAILTAVGAAGTLNETTLVSGTPSIKAGVVLVVGVGSVAQGEPSAETWRRAAGAAARALAARAEVALVAPEAGAALVGALAEGAGLGAYRFTEHLSEKVRAKRAKRAFGPTSVTVLTSKTDAANAATKASIERAKVLVARQSWARDLVNTGPNVLYPGSFAATVQKEAGARGKGSAAVKVEVLDEAALAEGGFGGIIGVGQGSANGPRLVTVSYSPAKAGAHVALVGKGITFDSGGLCLKPAGSMITMKCDMAGAAAVVASVFAAADLGLPVAVTGYLCLAENMPSSTAQRPGDVLTMRDGTTVEMINTDAEGRMVLADGIALASESHPDAIVDVATLTGAAMVALGARTAAIMSNDDDLQADLASAATSAGEAVWPMPIAEEIRKGMESDVADLKHTGDKYGGAMVAAAFLREFVGPRQGVASASEAGKGRRFGRRSKAGQESDVAADVAASDYSDPTGAGASTIPWGHLDIAGPAFNESAAYGYTPKGGTGYAVRTLVTYLEGLD